MSPARPISAVRDADLVEVEARDLGELARALDEPRQALLESTSADDPWGQWSYYVPKPRPAPPELESLGAEGCARSWPTLERAWSSFAAGSARPDDAGGEGADDGAPIPPFRGGFVVAISYDAARALPDFAPWESRAREDDDWPWFEVRLAGELVATHVASGRTFLVASRHPSFGPTGPRIEELRSTVERGRAARSPSRGAIASGARLAPTPERDASLRSNMSDADYARAFDRLQDYLRAGDLYQANLTRRFEAPCASSAGDVYARLRSAAPAPYSAWIATPHGHVLSASPELFLARRGDRLITRPIKGTRPRRADPRSDAAEAAALLASAKDRAEHVMIVDVHRNDLGRVCEYGSVRVETLAGLERFPTVHHLTSTIVGRPRRGVTPWQAIAAAFPAGSITGAPKRRAIEVIEELEPTRRAFYCGALGWIGFDGEFALNVAIRTILLRDGRATFQAGGGIVIDSECAAEAEETWTKARALYAALDPAGAPAAEADA